MNKSLLSIKGLSISFSDQEKVVNNLSLDIKEKETLADGIEKEDQAFVPELPPMEPPKDSD